MPRWSPRICALFVLGAASLGCESPAQRNWDAACSAAPDPAAPDGLSAEGCTMQALDTPHCRVRSFARVSCEAGFGSYGIRVAAQHDGATLVGSDGARRPWLFRAGEELAIEPLPEGFAAGPIFVGQANDGELAFVGVSEPLGNSFSGPLRFHRRGEDGAWDSEAVTDSPFQLRGFELDASAAPHLWASEANEYVVQHITRDADGLWSSEFPDTPGIANLDTLGADGQHLRIGYREQGDQEQLVMLDEAGQQHELGSPTTHLTGTTYNFIPLAPPRPGLSRKAPNALVLAHHDDFVQLIGDGGYELDIEELAELVESCETPTPGQPCSGGCSERAEGLIYPNLMAARSSEGEVWIGSIHTELDIDYSHQELCDETGCWCTQVVERDATRSSFVLTHISHRDRVTELMRVELEGYRRQGDTIERSLDMRIHGERLAVGIVGDEGTLMLMDIDIAGV